MNDMMTSFNTAISIATMLDRVFPQGTAALRVVRAEVYADVDSPAALLRAMADLIDPPKAKAKAKAKPKRKKADS